MSTNEGSLLIDGVVVIHTNWNFFVPLSSVYIKLPLILQSSDIKKTIKGTRSLRQFSNMWTLKLFRVNSFDVNLILCSNLRSIPYTEVIGRIRSAMNCAVSRLTNDKTKRFHDETNADSLRYFCIYQCDFREFGYIFEDELTMLFNSDFIEQFGTSSGSISVYFSASAFGQNASVEDFDHYFNLDWVNTTEIIVHVAKDFSSEGNVLFWRRRGIKEMFRCNPNYEYSNLGLSGAGNMYYIPTNMEGDVCFSMVKLYSDLTKHAKATGAFKEGEIAGFLKRNEGVHRLSLTNTERKKITNKINQKLESCATAKRSLAKIASYNCVTARIECLVSAQGGNNRWNQVIEYCKDLHKMNDFGKSTNLFAVNVSRVKHRLDLYLGGSLTTIETYLHSLQHCLSVTSDIFEFTTEDYMSVAVCEIISSFMLYGTAVSSPRKKRHNNKLVSILGLNVRNFRNELHPINKELGNSSLIMAEGKLRFCGKISLNDFNMIVPVRDDIQDLVCKFVHLIKTFENVNIQEIYKCLLEGIILSSLKVCKISGTRANVRQTFKFAMLYECKKLMTVDEYVKLLVQGTDNCFAGHVILLTMRHILNLYLAANDKIELFYVGFKLYLCSVLGREGCPALFCLPRQKHLCIILPMYLVETTENLLKIFVQGFNLKFPRHRVEPRRLYNTMHEVCKILIYFPLVVLETFTKMDLLFGEVLVCCVAKKSVDQDTVIKYFV